jgi:hypothetical protein
MGPVVPNKGKFDDRNLVVLTVNAANGIGSGFIVWNIIRKNK